MIINIVVTEEELFFFPLPGVWPVGLLVNDIVETADGWLVECSFLRMLGLYVEMRVGFIVGTSLGWYEV